MYQAILLVLQLLAVSFAHPPVLLVALIAGATVLVLSRRQCSNGLFLLSACLLVFPLALLFQNRKIDLPQQLQYEQLQPELEKNIDDALAQRLAGHLEQRETSDHSGDLFADVVMAPYESLSLLNLNLEPIVWKGQWFYDDYATMEPDTARFSVRDGRLFFIKLSSFPSSDRTRGFSGS